MANEHQTYNWIPLPAGGQMRGTTAYLYKEVETENADGTTTVTRTDEGLYSLGCILNWLELHQTVRRTVNCTVKGVDSELTITSNFNMSYEPGDALEGNYELVFGDLAVQVRSGVTHGSSKEVVARSLLDGLANFSTTMAVSPWGHKGPADTGDTVIATDSITNTPRGNSFILTSELDKICGIPLYRTNNLEYAQPGLSVFAYLATCNTSTASGHTSQSMSGDPVKVENGVQLFRDLDTGGRADFLIEAHPASGKIADTPVIQVASLLYKVLLDDRNELMLSVAPAMSDGLTVRLAVWRTSGSIWNTRMAWPAACQALKNPMLYDASLSPNPDPVEEPENDVVAKSLALGLSKGTFPETAGVIPEQEMELLGVSGNLVTNSAPTIKLSKPVNKGDYLFIVPQVTGFEPGNDSEFYHFGRENPLTGTPDEYTWDRSDKNRGWYPQITLNKTASE